MPRVPRGLAHPDRPAWPAQYESRDTTRCRARASPCESAASSLLQCSRVTSSADRCNGVEPAAGTVGGCRLFPSVLDPPGFHQPVERRVHSAWPTASRLADPQPPRRIVQGRAHDGVQDVHDHQRDPDTRYGHDVRLSGPAPYIEFRVRLACRNSVSAQRQVPVPSTGALRPAITAGSAPHRQDKEEHDHRCEQRGDREGYGTALVSMAR